MSSRKRSVFFYSVAIGALLVATALSLYQPQVRASVLTRSELETALGGAACINPSISAQQACTGKAPAGGGKSCLTTSVICVQIVCPQIGGNCCTVTSLRANQVCTPKAGEKNDCSLVSSGQCGNYFLVIKVPGVLCNGQCGTPNTACGEAFTGTTLYPCN
jgi:hypothetical protein